MDKQGLLNREGLWNRRGAWLGGSILGAALVGFHYLFVEQMLGALTLFSVAWLALLLAVFLLALVAWAGAYSLVRLTARVAASPLAVRRPNLSLAWLSAFQRTARSLPLRKWRGLEWAEVRVFSRPTERRHNPLRAPDSHLPHRRAA